MLFLCQFIGKIVPYHTWASLPLQQEFFERLYVMYTVGYSISFGSLAVAILIISYFRWVMPITFSMKGHIVFPIQRRHSGLTIFSKCFPQMQVFEFSLMLLCYLTINFSWQIQGSLFKNLKYQSSMKPLSQ